MAGTALHGQWYLGAGGGVTTLSADGQTKIDATATAVSLYKPENGPAIHAFGGQHVTDYFSWQGNYTWNRNSLALIGTQTSSGIEATIQQNYRSNSHATGADGLVYFRPRASRIRPFLSGGLGLLKLQASSGAALVIKGAATRPPATFESTNPYWRTAVGIDVRLTGRWAIRYSFWETISSNPISKQMVPPGQRGLATFQSIFAILRTF